MEAKKSRKKVERRNEQFAVTTSGPMAAHTVRIEVHEPLKPVQALLTGGEFARAGMLEGFNRQVAGSDDVTEHATA